MMGGRGSAPEEVVEYFYMKEFGITKRELYEEDAETVFTNLHVMNEFNKAQERKTKHGTKR